MHHHPGPGHRGQQWDEVILLCAQCQGQAWEERGEQSQVLLDGECVFRVGSILIPTGLQVPVICK